MQAAKHDVVNAVGINLVDNFFYTWGSLWATLLPPDIPVLSLFTNIKTTSHDFSLSEILSACQLSIQKILSSIYCHVSRFMDVR